MQSMDQGVGCKTDSAATLFSQRSPPLAHKWQLMTARTRRVSQTIIEVEAKSIDDITSGERRQARLPLVGRGPILRRRRMYQTPSGNRGQQPGLRDILAPTTVVGNRRPLNRASLSLMEKSKPHSSRLAFRVQV